MPYIFLDIEQRLLGMYLFADLLHGLNGGAQVVVGPNDHGDAHVGEVLDRRAIELGGHYDNGSLILPGAHERLDVRRIAALAVHEDGVGAGVSVGLGAPQRLVHVPAGDEGLDARHHAKVRIALALLHGLDLERELVDVGERLIAIVHERVGLGKELVLDADAGDAALLEFAHEATRVVEVAVAGVAVHQYGHMRVVAHELEHVDHLGPRGLVRVAHAQLGRYAQTTRPDALEARFLHNARTQAVVRLHQKLGLVGQDHAL